MSPRDWKKFNQPNPPQNDPDDFREWLLDLIWVDFKQTQSLKRWFLAAKVLLGFLGTAGSLVGLLYMLLRLGVI